MKLRGFVYSSPLADLGRRRSGRPFDDISNYDHSFKTVSLRNAKLSAPYFHNGAFSSLEKVMEFYNAGGGAGLGLDLPNQTLPFDSLNLTKEEQQKIIRFMESLTDVKNLTSRPMDLPGCAVAGQAERIIGGKY